MDFVHMCIQELVTDPLAVSLPHVQLYNRLVGISNVLSLRACYCEDDITTLHILRLQKILCIGALRTRTA